MLREVKYMIQMNEAGEKTEIPEDAKKLYDENEKFINYVTNLDYTTKSYNKIRVAIHDVEKPLVQKQLDDIDQNLTKAEKTLTWATPGKRSLPRANQPTRLHTPPCAYA